MRQRDVVRIAGGVVLGMALAAILGVGLFGVNLSGNTETSVTLWGTGSGRPCTLGKAPYVRAKKDKKVIWEIENYCTGESKTVTVGNFRTTEAPSGANNCDAAGAEYPFTDADLAARSYTVNAATQNSDGSVKASNGDIKLKVKGRGDLGGTELTYFFDICLDGQKADPLLMIER